MIELAQLIRHAPGLRKRVRKLRPVKPSKATEAWYRAELLQLVDQLDRIARAELLPLLQTPTFDRVARVSISPAFQVPRLLERIAQLARSFGGLQSQADRMAAQVARRALGDVDKRLTDGIRRSTKVDVAGLLARSDRINATVQAAAKANVDLITSIPVQHFERLAVKVEKGFAQGMRSEQLAKLVQEQTGVTKSRAKLIARDQIGKMNSEFSRVRQQDLGITHYIWRTAQDERVRDEHADLDGQKFAWSDPPSEGHPGMPIQCRCTAEPVFNLDPS